VSYGVDPGLARSQKDALEGLPANKSIPADGTVPDSFGELCGLRTGRGCSPSRQIDRDGHGAGREAAGVRRSRYGRFSCWTSKH
jgi:hypothetical protein